MKRLILLLASVLLLLSLTACGGQRWVCDYCGKEFYGDAYYDLTQTVTLCEDCARTYWLPLPYQNYKK